MANTDHIVLSRYCYIRTASAGVTLTLGVSGQTLSFNGGEVMIDFGEDVNQRPSKIGIESTSTVKFLPFRIERLDT